MARPKTKTDVGLRVPTEALNRLKELAAEREPKVSLYQFLTDIIVSASKASTKLESEALAQELESDLAEAFTFGEDK